MAEDFSIDERPFLALMNVTRFSAGSGGLFQGNYRTLFGKHGLYQRNITLRKLPDIRMRYFKYGFQQGMIAQWLIAMRGHMGFNCGDFTGRLY